VTHEYTILHDATVLTGDEECPRATALAWAADTILAIGETATVRAISRGDSRFIAEAVALADMTRAEAILASFRRPDPTQPARCLEIGEPADLAEVAPRRRAARAASRRGTSPPSGGHEPHATRQGPHGRHDHVRGR
jgi:hypothetical protein